MVRRLLDRVSMLLPDRTAGERYHCAPDIEPFPRHRYVRLLSFNIQVGISTSAWRHYLTRGWQHVLPTERRFDNLDRIAELIRQYDIVALQEVDGGSVRSGQVNQVEYLAQRSGHPFWYQQRNRNLGPIAQHSNGLLSRFQPLDVASHRLPGIIPGRGGIVARFGDPQEPLVLVVLHLALGARGQKQQLDYVAELIEGYRYVVVMGDLNAPANELLERSVLGEAGLIALPELANTFPSWKPQKALDHIFVSPALRVRNAGVLCYPVSDHLPIAIEVALPETEEMMRKE
ncbi:endonuclease/exonuclease/phosphatase family protein [Hahella sp. SMD15-11]|uniref:Endonuclease/exonuclease/phosphatase family protein n=1 Tax=Thermohahella caldifontis TaxID=3142973 RepID=A0AB39UUZ5_9GAMM